MTQPSLVTAFIPGRLPHNRKAILSFVAESLDLMRQRDIHPDEFFVAATGDTKKLRDSWTVFGIGVAVVSGREHTTGVWSTDTPQIAETYFAMLKGLGGLRVYLIARDESAVQRFSRMIEQ